MNKKICPSSFVIQITDNCMARCHQCDNWTKEKSYDELSTDEKLRLLEEICNLNKGGSSYVHFGGGEPFLKKDELLRLAGFCKQKKIPCAVDTTGYFIDEDTARQVSETDLAVQISLDSINPVIHDEMRRLENCHQRALNAVGFLLKNVSKDRVKIVTVIHKKNLDEIGKIMKFAQDMGIQHYLQPLMHSSVKEPGYIMKEYWPDDMNKINNTFRTIKRMNKQGKNMSVFNKKLSYFKKYFKRGSLNIKCNYIKNNLYIDCSGNVRPCFHADIIGNIRKNSLQDICTSTQAQKAIKKMENCKINCNIPALQLFPENRYQKFIKFTKNIIQYYFGHLTPKPK